MIVLILLGFVLASLAFLYFILTWNFDYWVKQGVPSAKPTVWLGSLRNPQLRKENLKYDLCKIYNQFKGKAPFVGTFQILRSPILVVLKPEMVKEVFIKSFKNFHDREFDDIFVRVSDILFTTNPFMSKGEEWKEKRAEITPAFSKTRLRVMYPLVQEVQDKLVKHISEHIEMENLPLDAREISTKYTVDVVAKAIYGIDAGSFVDEKPALREITRRLLAPAGNLTWKVFIVAAFPTLKKFLNLRLSSLADIEEFLVKLMEDSIKHREFHEIVRDDLLNHLIELMKKKGLRENDLSTHMVNLLTDGIETTAIVISHALYELGMNENVQNKLRDEINVNEGKIDFDKLNKMPYLDQVIHESLRLHPLATFVPRSCTEACKLECDGFKVSLEKGMNVYIPVHQIHHDSEHYENPESFIPERFDPENGGFKMFQAKGVFLAFGEGPRICLGRKFALVEAKAALAAIVGNFKISVNGKTANVIDSYGFINMKPGCLWLDFERVPMSQYTKTQNPHPSL